jgi:putative transposase
VTVKDLSRRRGFSPASFYLWRSKYGGMSVPDAKRLKTLEAENGRLKKLVAELMLETEVTRDNGKEFCGKDMLIWAYNEKVDLRLIEPGKPNQNGYIRASTGACATSA